MKLFKEGEKSKAICDDCNKVVRTTYKLCDIPLSSGKAIVSGVLAGVCDECDRAISIPSQSEARVQEVIKEHKEPIEARIPQQLSDVLLMICKSLQSAINKDRQVIIFRYLVHLAYQQKNLRKKLVALSASEDAKGKSSARFSDKPPSEVYEEFSKLLEETRLNQTDLTKAVIMLGKEEFLEKKNPARQKDLKELLFIYG